MAVETISVQGFEPVGEDCHFSMFPVCPDSVTVAVLPLQIEELLALPPAAAASTATLVVVE